MKPNMHPVEHGPSIREEYWMELDKIVTRIQTGKEKPDGRDPGRAEGIAFCLGIMSNMTLESIRAEAMERYDRSRGTAKRKARR